MGYKNGTPMEPKTLEILHSTTQSFITLWPYFLVTIPLAVAVEVSGISRHIHKAFAHRAHLAILLAVVVGAFSPFCSCGVIPVIYSLLKSGVPLAPVMAFWIASPSMDPEMFFLSVATLGWNLAVWRLASTFLMSLAAGYITLYLFNKGYLGTTILKVRDENCCAATSCGCGEGCAGGEEVKPSLTSKILRETGKSSWMVAKFMLLAFTLTALINAFVPPELITRVMGHGGLGSVAVAGLIGVPFYTSNLAAMPLISGLMHQGMAPAAALAFLISGPTTTLPAMSAVWGLTTRRVFFLYVSFSLLGSIVFGYLYMLLN